MAQRFQSKKTQIPQEYIDNEKKGVCRVCGKPKNMWNKDLFNRELNKALEGKQFIFSTKYYCSPECYEIYQKCFENNIHWAAVRHTIYIRDGCKCVKCNTPLKIDEYECDHIIAVVNDGDCFDETNLQTLCHICHVAKTVEDLKLRGIKRRQLSHKTLNYFRDD